MGRVRGVLVGLGILAGLTQASTLYTYSGPCTANALETCSADAAFAFGNNSVTITVNNDDINLQDIGQALSAIQFVLSAGAGGSLISGLATEVRLNGNGTYSNNGNVNAGWILGEAGATLTLDVLAAGGDGPAHTLLGSDNGSGAYSNANGSLLASNGNKAHNPFLASGTTDFGSLVFTIAINGVDSSTTVNSASFQFGATDGHLVSGSGGGGGVQGVPEPLSMSLTGAGLVIAGVARRRIRR